MPDSTTRPTAGPEDSAQNGADETPVTKSPGPEPADTPDRVVAAPDMWRLAIELIHHSSFLVDPAFIHGLYGTLIGRHPPLGYREHFAPKGETMTNPPPGAPPLEQMTVAVIRDLADRYGAWTDESYAEAFKAADLGDWWTADQRWPGITWSTFATLGPVAEAMQISVDELIDNYDIEFAKTQVRRIIYPRAQRVAEGISFGPNGEIGMITHDFDDIAKPAHYHGKTGMQAWDVAEEFGLDADAYLFTAWKYLARAGKKPGNEARTDIEKAQAYLTRWLDRHNRKESA